MFNPRFQYDCLFTALILEILSVQLKWALKCPWGQLVSTAWQRVEQQTAPSDAADLTRVYHLRCLSSAPSELSNGSRYKRLGGAPADRVTWHLLCDTVTADGSERLTAGPHFPMFIQRMMYWIWHLTNKQTGHINDFADMAAKYSRLMTGGYYTYSSSLSRTDCSLPFENNIFVIIIVLLTDMNNACRGHLLLFIYFKVPSDNKRWFDLPNPLVQFLYF